uniref:Uncharacterized protein n=1 Tax=Anopheles minimus TaxID=112268 RepID=A0A182WPW1_9DIPT
MRAKQPCLPRPPFHAPTAEGRTEGCRLHFHPRDRLCTHEQNGVMQGEALPGRTGTQPMQHVFNSPPSR